MKETYWGYWLIVLGILIIGVMLLVNNTSTSSNNDYYTIKEVTQASMIDAIDMSYYRMYGDVKMSEQKFVQNFLRRFADNTSLSNSYNVSFYDLYEVPPKVSVKISSSTNTVNVAYDPTSFEVQTTIDAILEVGVPSESVEKPELKCPLFVSGKFAKALIKAANKGNLSSLGNVTRVTRLYNTWVDLCTADTSCNGDIANGPKSGEFLRQAFNQVYSELPNLNTTSIYQVSNYPELKEWENKGYIEI